MFNDQQQNKAKQIICFSPLFIATDDGLFKVTLLTILQYMRNKQSTVGHVTVTRRFQRAVTTPDEGNDLANLVIVVCDLCDVT